MRIWHGTWNVACKKECGIHLNIGETDKLKTQEEAEKKLLTYGWEKQGTVIDEYTGKSMNAFVCPDCK